MPIEIRQLVVRSSVAPDRRDADPERDDRGQPDEESVRQILEECRRMIRAALDDRKER